MSPAQNLERAIMAADAIGCAAAGVATLVTPAGAIVAATRPRRIALAAALTLSNIALGQGSAMGRWLAIATGLLDATAGAVQGLLALRRRRIAID